MEDYQIRQLGLILAEFTKGLGMMSENMRCQVTDKSMAYSDNAFYDIASNIESYVNDLR